MPLPLTVSCFSKIQIGFTFLAPAHPGSPGKRAVKRVCIGLEVLHLHLTAHISCPRGAQQQTRRTPPLLMSTDGTDRQSDGRFTVP